jgi:hypothetical protein
MPFCTKAGAAGAAGAAAVAGAVAVGGTFAGALAALAEGADPLGSDLLQASRVRTPMAVASTDGFIGISFGCA